MKSKEEAISELVEQGARIVFAQHILSGNRDERVREYLSNKQYDNILLNLQCANFELVNYNKELSNKINLLEYCEKVQNKRIQGLDKELVSYKEKYEIALKAIEELEKTIDKGHYVKRCCK
jgi:hypothetical protein